MSQNEPGSSDPLVITREESVATLWLNRPDKRNAVTHAMWQGISDMCEELAAWAPLVGRHADNDTVPSCLDAFEGRPSLRRVAIDGFEIVVSLCGSGAGTSAELDAVSAGCRRILNRI